MLKRILLTLGLIGTIALPFSFAEDIVRVATGEWPPHNSEHMKHYGVVSHVITESFALEGVTTKYSFFPWRRALIMTKKGEQDALSFSVKNAEREEFLYYSDPLFKEDRVFFHLKSYQFDWTVLDDLKGIQIVTSQGYDYGKAFNQAKESGKLTVEAVTYAIQIFKMLNSGRTQLALGSLDGGYYLLQTEFTSEAAQRITHHPKPVHQPIFYLAFSKQNKNNIRLIRLFNRGLKRLKESGRYDQFFAESRRGEYTIK